MDPAFNDIQTNPWNEIFKVVFFPDRIYHAQYLNATRSDRYRYDVTEVRSYLDLNVVKGQVFLDAQRLCNFLRIEYRASRLVEQSREKRRLLGNRLTAWVKLVPEGEVLPSEAFVKLTYCPWIRAFQAEIWETLEAPANTTHDYRVLDQMGRYGAITRVRQFGEALRDIKSLRRVELAFTEDDTQRPSGHAIAKEDAAWDNQLLRSHQEPIRAEPSSDENTIRDQNYLVDFQRGWYLQASEIKPVRYRNAMMDADNPDRDVNNIIDMRWIVQRELGGSMVFFHEVTVPPGIVEGTHQHIGTEELYYITEGEGIAYMRVGDDPKTDGFPTVSRHVMGLGYKDFKELPVRPGSVIFTKSGGMHGIRNPGAAPLKFVAFLYHTV